MKPELISASYKAALQEKERTNPWKGTKGKYAPEVAARIRKGDRILDFGCARQTLGALLRSTYRFHGEVVGYDPAQPGLDRFPEGKFHIVVATDVLEHIEPQYLIPTLQLLESRCLREMFLVISTRATGCTLSDGLDHHRIVQPKTWWLETLGAAFPAWSIEEVFTAKKDFGCWVAR